AGREKEKNVTADDGNYYKRLFETSVCSICSAKFTYDNPPSIDRQNNELPHTQDNCLPACVSCNIAHANRDPKIASLHIKMRQYAIKHNLSMTISEERIYKLFRECITRGFAAVFHRENIAETLRQKTKKNHRYGDSFIAEVSPFKVHYTTVARSLKDANMMKLKRFHRPRLMPRHKEQNKKFCDCWINKNRNWGKVVWTDEKKNRLDGPDAYNCFWVEVNKEATEDVLS
ncbi:MAG: hypothetical protein EZS28_026906, partial [Streblomastix strix]